MSPITSPRNSGQGISGLLSCVRRRQSRSCRATPPRHGEAGFTLLELIVTLTILAMTLALAVPNFRGSNSRARLQPLVAELITNLKRAHATAKSTGKPVAFVVEPASHGYRIENVASTVVLPPGAALSITPPSRGLRQTPPGRMIFYPDGSSSGGQITISDERGRKIVLSVEWLNGTIRASGGAQ